LIDDCGSKWWMQTKSKLDETEIKRQRVIYELIQTEGA
jgi:hypothetical protein